MLHQIVNNVEKHQIPPSLTINFDQTPSKYVQVLSTTMDQKGECNVPIAGSSEKKKYNRYVFHHVRQQIPPSAADLPRQNRPKSTQSEFSGRLFLKRQLDSLR